jgi:hypothetical protein
VELWARNGRPILSCDHTFEIVRDLLHAANLRHGTNDFTSLPKEGMLRIFSPEKSDGFGRVWTRELGFINMRQGLYLMETIPTYPSWKATPFWPSKTAYSFNFQLRSISRGRVFQRKFEDATCLDDTGLLKMAICFSPRITRQGREADYLNAYGAGISKARFFTFIYVLMTWCLNKGLILLIICSQINVL